MSRSNTLARSLHDLGAAGWFGGVLMGATAANRAPKDLHDPLERGRAVNGVWRRWWPVNAAFAGAHLLGGAILTGSNRNRIVGQRGVASVTATKATLTAAAGAAAAYSGWLGKKISDAGDVPLTDGTTPSEETPDEVAGALRQQAVLQWLIPAVTGALIVVGAKLGEQQRVGNVTSGVLARLTPGA